MLFRIIALIIMICSLDVDYIPRTVQWPLGEDVTPWRGYGQYNRTDGFHWALDFHGSEGDSVLAPSSNPSDNWVLEVSPVADSIIEVSIEGQALIGAGRFATLGWHYAHINIAHPNFPFPSVPTPYPLNRAYVAPLAPYAGLGSHVHFAWLGRDSYQPPFEQPGLFNPFGSLPISVYPFAVASFGQVKIEGDIVNSHGILFVNYDTGFPPDNQERVRDVMDIIVHPYTSYITDPANDKCAVSEVMWRLLKQNCSTLDYRKFAILGNWRTLFNFNIDEEIPDPSSPELEYYKVYFPDQYHWENAVVLTNTCDSPREEASFEGVKTVWINSFSRQADDDDNEYCRGAWDTRLCTFDDGNPAYTDEAARFPDGRYAIEVIAFPQSSDSMTCIRLPVDNITLCDSEVTGIIVDNWAPRITHMRLNDDPVETVMFIGYEINEPNNVGEGRKYQYFNTGSEPYIGTGPGTNEYSLEIWYSEPVIPAPSISNITIKMVTGPDSSITWSTNISFALDLSCLNPEGECEYATYTAFGGARPGGYVGNQIVELAINSSWATDLNGNGLDADATTIAPALGEGGYDNRETAFTWIEPHWPVSDYHRVASDQDSRSNTLSAYYDDVSVPPLASDQDSRSNTLYAYYDAVSVPPLASDQDSRSNTLYAYFDDVSVPPLASDQDSRSNILYAYYDDPTVPPHTLTLTGVLTTAELFSEITGTAYSRCDIYSGVWMCDVEDFNEVLSVYIVDYLGIVKLDEEVFNFSAIDASGDLFGTYTTYLQYPPENPWENPTRDFDRFGWLAWSKRTERTPPPEDGSNNTDSVRVYDIELHISAYDSYTGNSFDSLVCVGQSWYDSLGAPLFETDFWKIIGAYPGDDGRIKLYTHEYHYQDTIPVNNTYSYDPPASKVISSNSINQDDANQTELSSRGIVIEDYFTVFPNPARESVSIDFMTSEDVNSTIRIYDLSGHLVNTIAEELPGMRNHYLLWDLKDASGNSIPVGIYYVSLVTGSLTETRTVIVCQ